jgi:peptidoglycan DL-endopeptidase LytE
MKKNHLFMAIVLLTFFTAGYIYADTTYTIKKGDNPSRLARKFKVSAAKIMEANDLRPHGLKPGTKITIPSNKSETRTSKKESRPGKKIAKRQVGSSRFSRGGKVKDRTDSSYYSVRRGDTLSSIARKCSMPVSELRKINNLRSTRLRIGQRLAVKKSGPKTYTVKRGDNIYRIAKRFDMDVDEIKDINTLGTEPLRPGQKILLEPEPETEQEPGKDEAVLSQGHAEQAYVEEEIKKVSELKELSLKERLILFAKKMTDIPYRFGGSSLFGIDCSAFVQKVYGLVGMEIPRSAREQFSEGDPVDKEELSVGDLVFFRTYASFPSHVGIYLGNNLFIHASSRSRKVTVDSLETPYYLKRFIGAKRLIEGKQEKEELQKEG